MSTPEIIAESQRWIRYAREDLEAARGIVRSGGTPRHACWLSQQSAEKAIKAVLVFLQIDFPKSHDLDRLRSLVPVDWSGDSGTPDLAALTEWAVESRYPGDWPDASAHDASVALSTAALVVESAESQLARYGV